MAEHLGTWQAQAALPAEHDPLAELRDALAPVDKPARHKTCVPRFPSSPASRGPDLNRPT
jgi:hypothetical protein